jgi:hypothetical protein
VAGLKHAAIGPGRRASGVVTPRGVQGIASNLDDLLLRGDSWKAQLGDALASGTLSRRIKGASTLEIEVHDVSRRLLRSQLLQEEHEVSLDGMPFRFVKARTDGLTAPLTLTYEPLVVALMRKINGPHKAFREKQTRAEFCKRRVGEIKPVPRFVSPELHVRHPVEDSKAAREAADRRDDERRKGIGEDRDVLLRVKGDPASKPQRELGERALELADECSAPERVMIALIAALIVESELGTLSSNVLQGEGRIAAGAEREIVGFLTGKNWTNEPGGAIGYFKRHPDAKAYEIAQAVQASGAGASTNGRANYGAVVDEAADWVAAFGGSGVDSIEFVRYAFKQGKDESNWKVCNRLAGEVRWRFFESVGWVYMLTDRDLLDSRVRFAFNDSTPGLVNTTFDLDLGKESDEMTVKCYARAWAAPPGTVVEAGRHGPADGLWIVEKIDSSLARRNSLATVELKRPAEPKPEPSPKTRTTSFGSGSRTGNAPPEIAAIIEFVDAADAKHYPYVWGGGHGSFSPPWDCSGFISAALHAAGLLDEQLTSGALAGRFEPGEGEWLTIYADAQHVFAKVKYPDGNWRFFGTSHSNPNGGAGWVPDDDGTSGSPAEDGKAARHPKGL